MNVTIQPNVYQDWLDAKEAERQAVERRRAIEDRLVAEFEIPENLEGTRSVDADGYTVKIIGRIDRKVDGDALQEIATEAGLSDFLSTLFRWKPEINAAAWKAADSSITDVLSAAITAKPGRPSFTITKGE